MRIRDILQLIEQEHERTYERASIKERIIDDTKAIDQLKMNILHLKRFGRNTTYYEDTLRLFKRRLRTMKKIGVIE